MSRKIQRNIASKTQLPSFSAVCYGQSRNTQEDHLLQVTVSAKRRRDAISARRVFLGIESMSAIDSHATGTMSTCGYALSTADHQCRHCATALPAVPSRPFDAKDLQQMITAIVVGLSVVVHLIFFR
jgi:hypothetical protein